MIEVQAPPTADLAELIKEVGRGPHGTRDLGVDTANRLFAAILAGAVPPLELGKILLTYRAKGETVAELRGFMAALELRVARQEVPANRPRPVILPTYSGSRRFPNLTALLALLLKRYGVPVLLHGMGDEGSNFGRVTTVAVLRELGIAPSTSIGDVQQRLTTDGITYAPIAMLSPALAKLLALRSRMGLRGTAHTLAKLIDPFGGAGFRVVSVTHSGYLARIHSFLAATRADALLMRGTEGEPFANPRRQPQLEWFERGVATVLFDAQTGSLTTPPALPASIDARSIAAWIGAALAGEVPIPQPILNQLACCMHATRQQPVAA